MSAVKQVAIAKALGVDPSAPYHKGKEYIVQSFRRLSPQQRKEWLDLARAATGIDPEQDDKTPHFDPM